MGKREEREKDEGGVSQRMKVGAAGPIFTMDDLDCSICCHPMRPPIFQVISLVFDLISGGTTQALGASQRRQHINRSEELSGCLIIFRNSLFTRFDYYYITSSSSDIVRKLQDFPEIIQLIRIGQGDYKIVCFWIVILQLQNCKSRLKILNNQNNITSGAHIISPNG